MDLGGRGLLGWQAGGPRGSQAVAEMEADRLGQKGWVLATKTACNSWLTLRTKLLLHCPVSSQTQWSLANFCSLRSTEQQTAHVWDGPVKSLVKRKVLRLQISFLCSHKFPQLTLTANIHFARQSNLSGDLKMCLGHHFSGQDQGQEENKLH